MMLQKHVGQLISACLLSLIVVTAVRAEQPTKAAQRPLADWVKRSNANAKLMLELLAKLQPEMAAEFGVEGYDDQISDLSPGFVERELKASRQVHAELVRRLAAEGDPRVKQDLEILVKAASDIIKGTELTEKLKVPDYSLDELIFTSFRGLLDDQVSAGRRPARSSGCASTPGSSLAPRRSQSWRSPMFARSWHSPGCFRPSRPSFRRTLARHRFSSTAWASCSSGSSSMVTNRRLARLKEQLAAWDEFVKSEVLPRSRDDFRLPPELYAFSLEQIGIDIPPVELATRAHLAYSEIQGQMREVAAAVAGERKLPSGDYREVIKALKREQLVGPAILPHYKARLKEVEAIIRDKQIVSLPERRARVRIATEAESAAIPAPNMHPPRLIGNTGEVGEFVLPLNVPDKSGRMQQFDDFTFAAASWTLTAHEARPGHELQFASIVEQGVSDARVTFAFNSTNVEGWGLYAEWLIEPYEPAEGRLICLQHRLVRAARAFLDIELQTGKITREQALATLKNDVVLSDRMANQEVERYTFRAPGQANSYFYGYTRLRELRGEVEKAMGNRFRAKAFHDFILRRACCRPDC